MTDGSNNFYTYRLKATTVSKSKTQAMLTWRNANLTRNLHWGEWWINTKN